MSGDGRRVVVTGMGCLSPVGRDVASTWRSLCEGRSGIGPVTLFDPSGLPARIAGEVDGFDPVVTLGVKGARRTSRAVQLAVAAAREAVVGSGLEIEPIAGDVAVVVASGIGGIDVIEQASVDYRDGGAKRVSPYTAIGMLVDMPAAMIAADTGAKGPNFAVVSACASGTQAIGEAAEQIRRGAAIAALTGGTEASITGVGMAMFASMGALSRRNDEPERASRPFDRHRDGFVVAEGAAVLVLEDLDHARRRGAPILAELVGHGATADAGHETQPAPDGSSARRCIQRALQVARLRREEVAYVNAHGTATTLNDVAETRTMHAVFGDHAGKVPITSTKSMTGHLLGASGAVEAVATIMALRDGVVPPTINLDEPDPECDLDYVPHEARSVPVPVALSTSFGFGGHNACIAFARFRG